MQPEKKRRIAPLFFRLQHGSMRLVTWNTQWCRGVDGRVSPERIVRHARALGDFEVLCLQEIACNYPGLEGGVPGDQARELAALLPGFVLFFGASVDEFDVDGDFNVQPHDPEHAALVEPFAGGAWWDAWPLVHGQEPRVPTFSVHEQKATDQPVAFDFVFVSDELKGRVRSFVVDGATQASDHQPTLVELGG